MGTEQSGKRPALLLCISTVFSAAFDMHTDNALTMDERIATLPEG